MPGAHAKLSPSAAKRWMLCPGSVAACDGLPNVSGFAAQWGTSCHWLLENALTTGETPDNHAGREVEGVFVDEAMVEMATAAMEWVFAYMDVRPGCEVASEQRVDIGPAFGLVPEREELPLGGALGGANVPDREALTPLWGTGDVFVRHGRELLVFDLKTGKYRVDAEHNYQLALYAIGFMHANGGLDAYDAVRMVIFQPKTGGADEWVTSAADLRRWRDGVRPAVLAALNPEAGRVAGREQCQWCLARQTCPAKRSGAVDMLEWLAA